MIKIIIVLKCFTAHITVILPVHIQLPVTLLVQSVTHRCTWHTDIVCVQIYYIDVTYWPNGSGAIFVKFSFPNACAL